jgi:hypothetical protein
VLPAIESREFSLKIEKYMNELKSGVITDEFGWLLKA